MVAAVLDLPATGGCRCEACRYSFDSAPFVAYTCHCRDCQKLTGSAFLTCLHIAAEALELTAGESVVDERPTDSGNLVRTHFCLRCGGSLYARNSARPRMITLHVGSMDHPEQIEVRNHIWIKRKLPWIIIPAGHRTFSEGGDWREEYARDPERYGE